LINLYIAVITATMGSTNFRIFLASTYIRCKAFRNDLVYAYVYLARPRGCSSYITPRYVYPLRNLFERPPIPMMRMLIITAKVCPEQEDPRRR